MTNTTVSVATPSKYAAIADATTDAAKSYRTTATAMSNRVDAIAPTVFLAYSTGYVTADRMTADERKAHSLAGGISQKDYVALFAGRDSDAPAPSVTTVKRWKRLGAVQAAGIDVKSAEYRWLKVGSHIADDETLRSLLDSRKIDAPKVVAAIETAMTAVKDLDKNSDEKKGETPDETPDKREAQVSQHAATNAEIVATLVAIVGSLKVADLTPDEYGMAVAAHTALGVKFEQHDKQHAATEPVKRVSLSKSA